MVAPVERPKPRSLSPAMRRAHRLVAATLLGPLPPEKPPVRVPKWKAWLLAAWAVFVTGIFLYSVWALW